MNPKNLDWIDYHTKELVCSIKDMPKNVMGFVYLITYVDNSMYIGKKNLYSTRTVKARKDGKFRPNTLERIYRNTGKNFRQAYDLIKVESNWKTYLGSHKECQIRIPEQKEILQYAFTNLQLTYLEAKWLFSCSVLERTDFINDNILGKFYRNVNDK